ncbi:MAG: prepilin-type N-terminal cleavage/methylation domain-containing protein [Rhodocyclaceae bacterium]|nr:prepilin-type N-terminal cleavage/methylation domain-containing protein [Rhodocyclaceae bacterium]MCA3022318.1 prepilin-type N-terminal cleavage/methylation domain-containing protein [Rhodocyclaceae bacterium]MCA3053943.1 prepilin-type N-terminal cleavage/methylation domain-containing protein [Rhodocyclaceae bacterium]
MLISSPPSRANLQFRRGFSLVEIAVVLVIIAILATAIGVPLASQLDQQRTLDTQKQLEVAREAIYGFAMANGRLPCPAAAATTGVEAPVGGGACTTAFGFLPATTLGLTGLDPSGYMVDPWNNGDGTHRIRYAVSTANSNALTTADGIKTQTMDTVTVTNQLYVCGSGLTAAPPTANCGTMTVLNDKAPFVIYSLGKSTAQNSNDETNNQNSDRVFTSGTPTATFDDLVTWGSLNTLFSRMVQAGKLP